MPTKGGGQWWILVHDLAVEDGRQTSIRPIHALTFLCRHLVKRNHVLTYQDAFALEAKLGAVVFQYRNLVASIPVTIEYTQPNHYVRDASYLVEVGASL